MQPYCSHFDIDGPCGHGIPCPHHGNKYADTREWDGDNNVVSGKFLGDPKNDPYAKHSSKKG